MKDLLLEASASDQSRECGCGLTVLKRAAPEIEGRYLLLRREIGSPLQFDPPAKVAPMPYRSFLFEILLAEGLDDLP